MVQIREDMELRLEGNEAENVRIQIFVNKNIALSEAQQMRILEIGGNAKKDLLSILEFKL